MTNSGEIKEEGKACRIGGSEQSQFWCGFCREVVASRVRGLDASSERFDHIEDHFNKGKLIGDWRPVDHNSSSTSDDDELGESLPKDEVEGEVGDDVDRMRDECSLEHSWYEAGPNNKPTSHRSCADSVSVKNQKSTPDTGAGSGMRISRSNGISNAGSRQKNVEAQLIICVSLISLTNLCAVSDRRAGDDSVTVMLRQMVTKRFALALEKRKIAMATSFATTASERQLKASCRSLSAGNGQSKQALSP